MNFARFIFGLVISLPMILHSSFANAGTPVFGRYVGTLRHDALGKEQLAKLDLITDRTEGNTLKLLAVLTLHFGDFRSKEYVTYHFDDVRYNLLTGTLVFAQADQDLTLVAEHFTGAELEARVRAGSVGPIGKLVLRSSGDAQPQLPIIEPIWGEYEGQCHTGGTILQLKTFRSTNAITGIGNPFSAMEISGRLGHPDPNYSTEVPVQYAVYSESSYEFFKGNLKLYGISGLPRTYECQVDGDVLHCNDGCTLHRTSKETSGTRYFSPSQVSEFFGAEALPTSGSTIEPGGALEGDYSGYVYHEYLGKFQAASMHLVTFQAPTGSGGDSSLNFSAAARLYFGGHDSGESLSYQFAERSLPLDARNFVLNRADADVNAIIQVQSIKNGIIKGVWYSRTFGRVGPFELRRNGLPELPAGAAMIEAMTGPYESEDWNLNIQVALGQSAINTQNPFYPLAFHGSLNASYSPYFAVSGGSFDFYTGRIAFNLRSGILAGEWESRQKLFLRPLWDTWRGMMPEHELLRYREIPK